MSLDDGALDDAMYAALNVSAVTTPATGGVHRGLAPKGTATPYLRFFSVDPPPDTHVFRTARIGRYRYLVQVIDKGLDAGTAKDVMAAADGVLHDATLTVTGATFLKCRRERRLSDLTDEQAGGVVFQMVGAHYLIEVQHT